MAITIQPNMNPSLIQTHMRSTANKLQKVHDDLERGEPDPGDTRLAVLEALAEMRTIAMAVGALAWHDGHR
jgi:hypothetical protein